MKIKSTLSIILFSIIFFTSCDSESVKCDGNLEKETVIGILKDEMLKQKSTLKFSLGFEEEYIHKFFDSNLELNLIRTTAVNKELKSCECSAQLNLKLKQEVIDFALKNAKDQFAIDMFMNLINETANVEYTVQKTSEDVIVETTIPTTELVRFLGKGFLLETTYNDSKTKLFESGDTEIKLSFLNENQVEITINSYDHSETFDLEYKNGLLINKKLPENLRDKYYILDGENLKVFVSEEDGYELYKKK
jgi:hypothetical protein